ncbi:MAG: MerR family transcriptional regulator [Nocardioides sp.]
MPDEEDSRTRLRSGEVAVRAGVNLETLRYYERRGLLQDPMRSPGGHRLYPLETVTTLRVIKAAQRLGFTLREVAELLEAGRHRHGRASADGDLQQRARLKLGEVADRISDLEAIRDRLTDAIGAGCDDLTACEAAGSCCPIPFAEIAQVPGSPAPSRARGHEGPGSEWPNQAR